jgi:phospholipase C
VGGTDDLARERIEHVVVLMLENRSFDHLFGFLDHPAGDAFPGLRGKQFPNPHDLTERNGTAVDVSDDAAPVLAVDPPHGHLSAKVQMNGRRWRAFLMNGFVTAYAQKLAGREPIAIIHWARLNGFLVLLSPLFAAALSNLGRRVTDGDIVGFLGWFVPTGLVVAGLVRGLQIDRLLGWRWRKLVGPLLVVAFVLAAVAEGTARLFTYGWDGLTPWWLAVVGVVVPLVWRQAQKARQRARVPHDQVRGASERVMRCMPPEHIPVMGTLAREFAVCTAWHSPVPGATWPNRNFAHAGTSEETVDIDIGFYDAPTIFELLDDEHPPSKRPWHIYYDGRAQLLAFHRLWSGERAGNWFPMKRFFEHVADDTLPMYSFVEPRHGGPHSNSQHPGNNEHETAGSTDFERGEDLVRRMYEALRARPEVFEKTLFVVTYDEHGGLFDHVPPPRAKHPEPLRYARRRLDLTRKIIGFFVENRNSPFDFRCYGPRVPAVVVSPWIAPHTVDDTLYDHSSIIATVRLLFAPGRRGLTRRDRSANSLLHLVADLETPREMPPLPATRMRADDAVPTETEPTPPPPLVTPTVTADLREQLPALAAAVASQLGGEGDPMERFAAYAEQQRHS